MNYFQVMNGITIILLVVSCSSAKATIAATDRYTCLPLLEKNSVKQQTNMFMYPYATSWGVSLKQSTTFDR